MSDGTSQPPYWVEGGYQMRLDPEFEMIVMARFQDVGFGGAKQTKKRKWLEGVLFALHRSGYRVVPRGEEK